MTRALADGARAFGIELTPAQGDAFETYYRELVAWNERINLTTITERDEVLVKHFLDSLSVAPVIATLNDVKGQQSQRRDVEIAARSFDSATNPSTPLRSAQDAAPLGTRAMTARVIDIGAGAGLPGIPLKIALPHLRVTLLEATGKKVAFLKHIIAQLDLHAAVALQARAEDLARDAAHRAQYDVAVARAVANLATLAEYALPFVRRGGLFIAQKGVAVDDEIRAAARALDRLGGRVRTIVPVQLPGLAPRHLVVIAKVAATPEQYPRRAGVPERQPLTH